MSESPARNITLPETTPKARLIGYSTLRARQDSSAVRDEQGRLQEQQHHILYTEHPAARNEDLNVQLGADAIVPQDEDDISSTHTGTVDSPAPALDTRVSAGYGGLQQPTNCVMTDGDGVNRESETHADLVASADSLLAREVNDETMDAGSQDIIPQTSRSIAARDIPAEFPDTNSNLLGSAQDTGYPRNGLPNMTMEGYAELGKRLQKVWELQELRGQAKSDVSKLSTDLENVAHEIATLEKELVRLREVDACSRTALESSSKKCEALEAEVNEAKRQLYID